jgi:Ca2+/Na+ antiporter
MMPINSLPGVIILMVALALIILAAIAAIFWKTFKYKTFFYIVILLALIVFLWYTQLHTWFKALLTMSAIFLFFLFMAGRDKHWSNDDLMSRNLYGPPDDDEERWWGM